MSEPNDPPPLNPSLQPVYRPDTDGIITLYSGDLLVESEPPTTLHGTIKFLAGSRPKCVVQFASTSQTLDLMLRKSLPKFQVPSEASISPPTSTPEQTLSTEKGNIASFTVSGSIKAGDTNKVKRLIFHLVSTILDPNLPLNSEKNQGVLPFSLPGWDLRLASVEQAGQLTPSFIVEAIPHQIPCSEEAISQLRIRLIDVINFVTGGEVGLAPDAGLDEEGNIVWAQWGTPQVQEKNPSFRWCPDILVAKALPSISAGYASLSDNENLEVITRRAIGHLLASDNDEVLEVKIPVACSGLELLAWGILQHHQWAGPDTLNKLSAGSTVRLLLQWANIPTEIPKTMPSLIKRFDEIKQAGWGGPEIIFNVRNGIVHPPKKFDTPEWPTAPELFETWQLATWYLQLSILRLLNYDGPYSSALNLTGWVGDIEPVPWSQ